MDSILEQNNRLKNRIVLKSTDSFPKRSDIDDNSNSNNNQNDNSICMVEDIRINHNHNCNNPSTANNYNSTSNLNEQLFDRQINSGPMSEGWFEVVKPSKLFDTTQTICQFVLSLFLVGCLLFGSGIYLYWSHTELGSLAAVLSFFGFISLSSSIIYLLVYCYLTKCFTSSIKLKTNECDQSRILRKYQTDFRSSTTTTMTVIDNDIERGSKILNPNENILSKRSSFNKSTLPITKQEHQDDFEFLNVEDLDRTLTIDYSTMKDLNVPKQSTFRSESFRNIPTIDENQRSKRNSLTNCHSFNNRVDLPTISSPSSVSIAKMIEPNNLISSTPSSSSFSTTPLRTISNSNFVPNVFDPFASVGRGPNETKPNSFRTRTASHKTNNNYSDLKAKTTSLRNETNPINKFSTSFTINGKNKTDSRLKLLNESESENTLFDAEDIDLRRSSTMANIIFTETNDRNDDKSNLMRRNRNDNLDNKTSLDSRTINTDADDDYDDEDEDEDDNSEIILKNGILDDRNRPFTIVQYQKNQIV